MRYFITCIFVIILAEVALQIIVNLSRKSFPWLITKQDEVPKFDIPALRKFIDYSFDPILGWVRKPNSKGIEHGQSGEIEFTIDSLGSRSNSYNELVPTIASFGDSYVFCRQVDSDQTWQAQLSNQSGIGVLNLGVGNYGVDQAFLRYENAKLPESIKVVIMGFVPETICRIQSCWKHYLEFGNTFAFKPRYTLLPSGKLARHDNQIKNEVDFLTLESKLSFIQSKDRFYNNKFRSLQFRFPYILSLARHPARQIKLIFSILARALFRVLGISKPWIENLPFTLIMRENINDAHNLYSDAESTELLKALLLKFKETATSRGHIPLVLVMPQLLDLKSASRTSYQDFFQSMTNSIFIIDVTDKLLSADIEKLYVNDHYGGHFSEFGNSLVMKEILTWLKDKKLTIKY